MARGGPSTLTLLAATVVLGVLAGALLIRETSKPIDASRLVPVRVRHPTAGVKGDEGVEQKKNVDEKAGVRRGDASGKIRRGKVMVASRRAIREIYAPVTFTGVVNRLFQKKAPAYRFRAEVYEPKGAVARKAPRAQLGSAKLEEEEETASAEALDDSGAQDENDQYPEGWDKDWPDQEVHLWSDKPPGAGEDNAGEVEIMDIIMYDLPVFIFFMALLLYVEVSACLWRRGRDFLLATAAWRGNDEAFKAQCAKESQIMIYRTYVTWFAVLGLWLVIKDSIDVYGKCFFNFDCWWNLDCHVRILMPAEAECVFDIMLPAAVVTGVLICGVLAAIWGFTRPWASLVLLGTFFSGVFAIWTVSLFACTLWVLCAVGFNYFYFAMLPYIDDPPFWCEDLGSLAFATNPRTGTVRDGDKAQHWKEDPDGTLQPSRSELATLQWWERVSYHIADFYHTHLRGMRVLWNGVAMRGLVIAIVGRRTRIFGEEHIKHLGSHDKVLVACNHRTFFDFWVVTVCGLWDKAGVTLFSFYPVRSTWFYTNFGGLLMNMGFSSFAMFPPIMNTPSDKKKNGDDKQNDTKNGELRTREDAYKWNDYAIRRVISDLKTPEVPDAHVVPCFIMGVESDLWSMFKKNWAEKPMEDPVDVVFGPRVDMSDLRQRLKEGDNPEKLWAEAGDRVTAAILKLAQQHPRLAQELREKEEEVRLRRYQGEADPNEEISSASV